MDNLNSVWKTVAVAFALALFSTACGSDQSEVGSDDTTTDEHGVEDDSSTEGPTTNDEPPEGFRRFTFTFSPEDVIADVYGGDLLVSREVAGVIRNQMRPRTHFDRPLRSALHFL